MYLLNYEGEQKTDKPHKIFQREKFWVWINFAACL